MSKAIFTYDGTTSHIQCKPNEKMKDICNSFCKKANIDISSIYFLYGGDKLKEELTFEENLNNDDKKRNEMNIIVNKINSDLDNNNKFIIKSKDIICPKCFESIKIKINNYKISLYNCINKHEIKDIPLDQFENTQNINQSKIICQNCNQNTKIDSYKSIFYLQYMQ